MKFEVVNIVAGIRTTEPIDINAVVLQLPYTQYEPDTFSGVVYHRRDPKATLIFFASGRMVTVGTSNMRTALMSIKKTVEEVSEIQEAHLSFDRFEIINIVATATFRGQLTWASSIREPASPQSITPRSSHPSWSG